jgi:carbamoyl-phosphate synthase large subunit
MKKRKLNIAISGLNNVDSPGPGIPVIRGIRDSVLFDARIIGLAYENLEPGPYMHEFVNKTYKVPYPSEGVTPVLERIEYIHERESIDVIIPNFDSEIYAFIRLEEKLHGMGIGTFLPTLNQFEERHKSNLTQFGKTHRVNVAKSYAVNSFEEIEDLKRDEKIEFPLMVKGKFYDAYNAQNMEQASIYFSKISAKWGLPVIVQEFIKGTEVNVVALGDGNGQTIGAVPMRKQYITDKGKAWGGITLDDTSMLEFTHHLISSTKWRGGMELELVRTPDNELYMIEINPRLPAWVYLAVTAGQNLPEAMVLLATGSSVQPYQNYDIGKMFIRYSFDMICDLGEFEKLSTLGEL